MIYTCTLNPSLDYYMEFEKPLNGGVTNRSLLEYYEAGGKGINISIVLNNLQIPTRALGFLGGFTKDYYIELLQKYKFIQPNFTYIQGNTRINVKLNDQTSTDLNAAGPYITDENMKSLMDKTSRLSEGDYFALAGNCQDYLQESVSGMLADMMKEGVKVILDTNPEIVREALAFHPFLIKTTAQELESYSGRSLSNLEEVIRASSELIQGGAENVLVLMGTSTAVFVNSAKSCFCDLLGQEKAVNAVGIGDSLTAGFLMNYIRSKDPAESFRFACACGSATAYSKGLATREKIDTIFENIELKMPVFYPEASE